MHLFLVDFDERRSRLARGAAARGIDAREELGRTDLARPDHAIWVGRAALSGSSLERVRAAKARGLAAADPPPWQSSRVPPGAPGLPLRRRRSLRRLAPVGAPQLPREAQALSRTGRGHPLLGTEAGLAAYRAAQRYGRGAGMRP